MFQDTGHRLLQSRQFQQPLSAGGTERDFDAGLPCIFLSFLQTALQLALQIDASLRCGLPTQVDRAVISVVRQRLTELHR